MKINTFLKRIRYKFKYFFPQFSTNRKEILNKRKLNVGSGGVSFSKEWFSCDIDVLDLTKKKDWKRLLGNNKIENIFAEHVWEHLNAEDTRLANNNCYDFLKENGSLRISVPDGYHPDSKYIDWVKPDGTGPGADDHKLLYNYKILTKRLEDSGFKVKLLEYWDENGNFHFIDWSLAGGKVLRSRRYDQRNNDGKLNYTSLIIDAIKEQ